MSLGGDRETYYVWDWRSLEERRPQLVERAMTGRLYDLRRWRRESRAYLARNPLCRMCEARGRVTLAQVVDHVVPHKGDEALFFDEDNWQPLCAPCHDGAKQSQERSGRIRGCDVNGLPLDPEHPWRRGA